MQPEETIQIEHRLAWDVDAGPHGVLLRFAVRDDDAQPIRSAALKNDDQTLVAHPGVSRAESRACKKTRHRRRADDGQRAITNENTTCDGHDELQLSALSSQPVKSKTDS